MPFEDAIGAPLQDGRETMMRSRPLSRDEPADGIPVMVYAVPERGWLLLSALATVAAMPQGLRTPPRLDLPDWALPSGFTIARQCGMDRLSKRDPLLRGDGMGENSQILSPPPRRPRQDTVPRCCGASRDPPPLLALVIEAEWRKRALARGSGAAKSAARRATPKPVQWEIPP